MSSTLARARWVPIWSLAAALVALARPASAEEILLRTDCGSLVAPACFTALADVLAEIHQRPGNGRTPPGPTHPVVVDIGAGEFALTSTAYPYCDGLSNLSFHGAGKNVSILTGGGYPNQPGFLDIFGPYTVLVRNCSELDFSNLTIRTQPGVSQSGVRFVGEGNTWWSTVRMSIGDGTGVSIAWLDAPEEAGQTSTHHWTDVQATVDGAQPGGFWITGSRHEFRASHLRVKSKQGIVYGAIYGSGAFDLNVEGSLIEMNDTGTGSQTVAALWFTNGAGFYPSCADARASISGSQIRASTTRTGATLAGILNYCQGFQGLIAARGDQFTLDGPDATRVRIGGSQAIDSPYDLGAGANPPTVTASWSRRGLDRFAEIDCGALCNDTPQGSEIHELHFDPTCSTAGPWLDETTGVCRGL